MKKIIGLTIAILVIIGLVGAGTYALFTSIQTSVGNTFTMGTLTLTPTTAGTTTAGVVEPYIKVNVGGLGINGNVTFGLLKPGDSGNITWTLKNTGTMPGNLTMVSNATGTLVTANGTEYQDFMVWVTRNGTDIPSLGTTDTYVPMSGMSAVLNTESQSIAAGGSLVYVINWQIPSDAGNEIQGATANLDITFTLTQNP